MADTVTIVLFVASLARGAAVTHPTHPDAILSDDGRTLVVSFAYRNASCHFKLTACSVYGNDVTVIVHGMQGQQQQRAPDAPRTFCSRQKGHRASVTLSLNKEVDGFFECDGQLFDFSPGERRLAETWDGAAPARPPTSKHLRHLHGGRALEGDDDGDYEVPEIAVEDDWHIPAAGFNNVAALSEWNGQTWFPGCYAGDTEPHFLNVGLIADVRAATRHGDQLTALIETVIARTSFVYESQLNIRIVIGSLQIYTSEDSAPSYAKGCPAINQRLNQIFTASRNRDVPLQAVTHILTGCGSGFGTVGIAYVNSLCSTRGYNTGVNQLQNSMSWVTFAHELGHNFGGDHSFEDGQGITGGIMDYGDGKLNGEYQFNTKYRKGKMCDTINRRVGRCNANFAPLQDLPTPLPTATAPTPPAGATPSPSVATPSTPTGATPSPTIATPSPPTEVYTSFGSGFCRGTSKLNNPSSWYTRQTGFRGDLTACQALCSSRSGCVAIEFNFGSAFHCELWTREPQATQANGARCQGARCQWVCMKRQVPTPSPTNPVPTPPPAPTAVTPAPSGTACSYSMAACHATAERLNLDNSGAGDRYPFAGNYSVGGNRVTGCFYFTSGTWAGTLWYGLYNGREVTQESELTTLTTVGSARPDGTHSCSETQAPTSQPTQQPTSPTQQPTPGCADQLDQCPTWTKYCTSEVYGEWVRAQCKYSCNACLTECADDYAACQTWKSRGFCERSYVAFMHTYCKKSCDVCDVLQRNVGSEPLQSPDFGIPAAPPLNTIEPTEDVQLNGGALRAPHLVLMLFPAALPLVPFN